MRAEVVQEHEPAAGQQQAGATAPMGARKQQRAHLCGTGHVIGQVQRRGAHMHAQLAGRIHRHAQSVIIEHLIQAHSRLYAADAHTPFELGILESKQVQASLRCAALVEGFLRMLDLPCQQCPIRGQCRQSLSGALCHGVQGVEVVLLQGSDYQHSGLLSLIALFIMVSPVPCYRSSGPGIPRFSATLSLGPAGSRRVASACYENPRRHRRKSGRFRHRR